MKTENKNQQTQGSQPAQGFISNPQVYLNEERGTLTHVLTDGMRITMPINLYKQILGLEFTKKVKEEGQARTQASYGLFARPSIYVSKDGKYLVHRVLGIRVSKHINFYKKILGAEFTSKSLEAKVA
jgi:hypothetical protein